MKVDLGPLEMRVLGLLDPAERRSVADVVAAMQREGLDPAYTTVMTVLSRLHEKALVLREKEKNRWLYRLAKRVPEVKATLLARLRRTFFTTDRLRPIAELVENDLSQRELEELRDLVQARLEERKR